MEFYSYRNYEEFVQDFDNDNERTHYEYLEQYENLFGKKFKKKLKDTLKGVGDKLKKAGQTAVFVPLLPFKKAMKKKLEKKGIKVGKQMREIVESFYNNIVRKKGNYSYEFFTPNAEPIDFGGASSSAKPSGNLEPVTISLIISAVLSFITKITKQPETQEDKELADEFNKSANDFSAQDEEEILRNEQKDDLAGMVGSAAEKSVKKDITTSLNMSNSTLILLAVGLFLLMKK